MESDAGQFAIAYRIPEHGYDPMDMKTPLIESGTPLYDSVAALAVGDQVEFDASLFPTLDGTTLMDQSFGQDVSQPKFQMRLEAIRKAD